MSIAAATKTRNRTPFIGRERERGLIADELRKGTSLLMLTGPSGMGKTRLARQVASEVAPLYEGEGEGGTWFCSVSGCQTASDVEAVVARTLGIPQKHGEELIRAIAGRGPTLFILDNVDSMAGRIGEIVGNWLDLCVELQIVATSIVPVGLEGEVRIEVGPLEKEDAIALYLERAHRAWGGRTFSATEKPAVDELVTRLDRIPLAIELAAARIRVLPPRTLLARFGKRFELLRSATPGRHGSLLQALQLTWELLPPEEQEILARASLFEGGFSYEAGLELLGMDGSEGDALDLLDGLRSKALLQIDDSEPPRFHLFESVKEYARLELERSGKLESSLGEHTAFFLERGEAHLAQVEGKNALESTRWLKAERENLLAVHLRNLESSPLLAARVGLALTPILFIEGHPPSEANLAETILDAARRSGEPSLIVRALETRAHAVRKIGKVDDALSNMEEALAIARRSGDRKSEGEVLVQIASLMVRQGRLDEATPLLDAAIELVRGEGAPLVEGMALLVRGEAELGRQALDEAEQSLLASIQIFRQHELVKREGLALTDLGLVWNAQGRLRDARRALHEALRINQQTESRSYEANTLTNLGSVDLDAGFLEEAEVASERALQLLRELGNRVSAAIAQTNLGTVALERYDLDLAEDSFNQAEGVLVEAGLRKHRGELLTFLAVLEARRGRIVEARRSLENAREISGSGDERGVARLSLIEGTIEIAEARAIAATNSAAADELVRSARSRLEAVTGPAGTPVVLAIATRLLERDLELWTAGLRESGDAEHTTRLVVGPEASWFELGEKPRVDLQRRVSIRRLLDTLVEKRLASPGEAIDPFELFEAGWTETLPPDIAMKRVYFGIWALRDLGLAGVLLHQTDGYLLDPKVPLLRQR